MTIPTTIAASGPYIPNGATVAFPFGFKARSTTDVSVVLVSASGAEEIVSSANYTVTLAAGDDPGGTVTMAVAPANDGRELWIYLDPTFLQEIKFEDEGAFNQTILNQLADEAGLRTVWLRERVNRAFLLPRDGDALDAVVGKFPVVLPGGIPGFATGTGSDGALRADLAAAGGALLVAGAAPIATSLGALAAIPSARGMALLVSGARSGMFRWDSSNLSAMVTLDTLQGVYVAPASDTTGASGAWVRVYSGAIDIRWFGAVSGTAVGDQKPAIQCAINVAQSGEVLIPIGQWRIDSGLTYAAPVNLYGEGMAAGPGAILNTNCSQISANFSSGDMLKVTSLYCSIIRNIQFNSNVGTRSSGAAVHLDGDGLSSTGSNSIVDGCAFNAQYECIRKTRYVQSRIENCYFQAWATWAIIDTTTGGNEPGTGYIAHNYFRGDTNAGTTQSGCILTRAGYAWIHDNMVLGGQVGIKVDVSEHDLGYPSIHDNSLEDQDVYCFYLTGGNSKTVSMLDVSNNEFSVIQTRANFLGCVQVDSGSYTIENADFEANVMRCNSGNANMRYFNFQNGNRMRVFNTTITHLSGNGLAVFVGGGSLASGEISYNSVNVVAGTMPKYSGLGVMRILDNEGVTFANLPTCANGSVLYCSDGTFANPVAGGGTGSWAKRLNSVWRGD